MLEESTLNCEWSLLFQETYGKYVNVSQINDFSHVISKIIPSQIGIILLLIAHWCRHEKVSCFYADDIHVCIIWFPLFYISILNGWRSPKSPRICWWRGHEQHDAILERKIRFVMYEQWASPLPPPPNSHTWDGTHLGRHFISHTHSEAPNSHKWDISPTKQVQKNPKQFLKTFFFTSLSQH